MERHDLFGPILDNANSERKELPEVIDIELTNTCNLACKFCPTGQKELKRPTGFMQIGLAWDIADQCSRYKIPVRFVRWGEPTLHPNFLGIVRLFKLYEIPLHIGTNGIKLPVKEIVEEEVDAVKISIHSLAGHRALEELLDERGDKEKPFIQAAYLEEEESYEVFKEIDKVTTSKVHDLEDSRDFIPECYEPWTRLSIDWDGKVTACCGDYDRKMVVGDLNLSGATIPVIWNGHKMQGYRNLIRNKMWKKLPLCRNCARGEREANESR